ncbi:MAG: methyltransferase family protein [Candidatus Odinarchaeota archaeon]
MIEPIFIKYFFIIIVVSFLIGMFAPIVIIKKKGSDPHGTHKGASLFTRLTPITIFSWLIYIIIFIINDSIILDFLAFELLISDIFIVSGIVIIFLGLILDLWGTVALGTNFRIEFPKEDTILITTGIYRLMRNPIVMGVYLLIFGSFLIIPTIISLFLLIANIITFDSKVRDEEKFLVKRFGEKFEKYSEKVGRYLPFSIRKNKN